MSHPKERKEHVCLNCGATLHGRYCHVCGQENIEPKESAWHLVTHFFYDITHFDGKFFSTVKFLLTRPGFLSREYMIGRRASYLNPVRLYVFTSAFFFLIFFALIGNKSPINVNVSDSKAGKQGLADLRKEKQKLVDSLKKVTSASVRQELQDNLKGLEMEIAIMKQVYGDSSQQLVDKGALSRLAEEDADDSQALKSIPEGAQMAMRRSILEGRDSSDLLSIENFRTVAAYDSAQRTLPAAKRDGVVKSAVKERIIILNQEWREDRKAFLTHLSENFLHSFPKILFVSLPFFALILKLLYVRRRQFFYVDHGIFTIHLYCAFFMVLFVSLLINRMHHLFGQSWVRTLGVWVNFGLMVYLFIYMYKAMRLFYHQSRGKTILKYLLVGSMAFTLDLALLVIFLIISVITA